MGRFISPYLQKGIYDQMVKEMRYRDLKLLEIMDITPIDRLNGILKYNVLVRHRMLKDDEGHKYNCTAFSILTYPDWTVSSADPFGTVLYVEDKDSKDCQFFQLKKEDGYTSIEDFARWVGTVRNERSLKLQGVC